MAQAIIQPVRNEKELKEFVAFPWRIYKDDPYWVPPIFRERMHFFDRSKNPFFKHSEAELFIARRDGEVVGTIAAILNNNHNAFQGERIGFFGQFECINDQDVANQLFAAASDWVASKGMKAIRGPMTLSTNDECGLLIDGFDSAPVAAMTYNPKYYVDLVENSGGFSKSMDLLAYLVGTDIYEDNPDNLPRKVLASCEQLHKEGKITIRKVNLRKFDEELTRAKAIYNSAWGRNWGFVPMTEEEITHLANSLRQFVDEDLAFIAEADGKPVGISVALPDINATLLEVKPKPGGFLRYLYDGIRILIAKRKHSPLFRLYMMGVVEGYRNRGIDACFYVETARNALAKGYRFCEMSWILENNVMMNRIIQRLGGKVYKTYRVYDRQLP